MHFLKNILRKWFSYLENAILVDCYHSRYQNKYEVAEERFDNISKGGLPSDDLKQAKIDEHERKTLPIILSIIIIVLLLMCIMPQVFIIVQIKTSLVLPTP